MAAAVACSISCAACAGDRDEKDGRSIDSVAAEARGSIDELAAAVGTDPEVRQDTITDCVPGRRDSGKDLIYDVRVRVEPGALQRLLDEVAPELEAKGWDARQRGDSEVVFRRDNVIMGATVFPDQGLASVSGSGGCVK